MRLGALTHRMVTRGGEMCAGAGCDQLSVCRRKVLCLHTAGDPASAHLVLDRVRYILLRLFPSGLARSRARPPSDFPC